MRFALLAFLIVPIVMTAKCYMGQKTVDGKNDFGAYPCPEDWCFKVDVISNGEPGVGKGCGSSLTCKVAGCSGQNVNGGCCCKGDLCNGAAGTSLLPTIVAVFLLIGASDLI